MLIIDTPISGLKIIEFNVLRDHRGHFARTFCAKTLAAYGLHPPLAQANLSFSHRKGTIRGLHYQIPPFAEAKLMRCTRGAILDVAVDLRPESATFLKHIAVELTSDNYRALYVPQRFANGYQALTDGAEAAYQVSADYAPEHERGVRFSDPRLNLQWPIDPTATSQKDDSWPLLNDETLRLLKSELEE